MSVEFLITITVLFGFTAYYFWYHSTKFPKVPTISWLCSLVFVVLSVWLGSAYSLTPEVESVTTHKIMLIDTSEGTLEVIKVDNKIVDVGSISKSDKPHTKVMLTRFKEVVLGIKLPRTPIIELIR